jgi:hypothetical protein
MIIGIKPEAEVCFAFRMMMLKYNLSPGDVFKIMVSLDKEKPPVSGGFSKGAGVKLKGEL